MRVAAITTPVVSPVRAMAIATLLASPVTVTVIAMLGRPGGGDAGGGESVEHVFAAGVVAPPPGIELKSGFVAGGVVGRRSVAAESRRGREVRAVPNARPTDLAMTATLHHSLMRTGGLRPRALDVTAGRPSSEGQGRAAGKSDSLCCRRFWFDGGATADGDGEGHRPGASA